MIQNRIFGWLIFTGILLASCQSKQTGIPDESYVAFSLKQAQQLIKQNGTLQNSAADSLGGITRLVGLVIDRENNDIILVGKKSSQLPAARFDDFVTALRARFVYNDLPMVSIDPVVNSSLTGKQAVRFGGHIEGTTFGRDFLESDILLKKYSLELAQQVQNVPSYKQLIALGEVDNLKQQGVKVTDLKWISADSLNKLSGQLQGGGSSTQSRFWYNYKAPYTVRIRGNVFCIMALDIMIEDEINENGKSQNVSLAGSGSITPGSQFSKLFTDNFYKISDTHPVIKKLKLLFDMTALAEGLKNTKNIPDISFLLKEYPVKTINTPQTYDLIKICALISRADGKTNLIQLSGGVGPAIDLQWLNAGDVSYLEKFVLQSRPAKNSLFWRIPADNWEMPNSNGLAATKHIENSNNNGGFSLNTRYALVNNTMVAGHPQIDKFFQGMTLKPLDAIPTKGVQMRMKIDSLSFKHQDSLKNVRDFISKP